MKEAVWIPRIRGLVVPRGKAFGWEMLITVGPDDGEGGISLGCPEDRKRGVVQTFDEYKKPLVDHTKSEEE